MLDIEPTHNYIILWWYLYLIILQEFGELENLNSQINYKIVRYVSFSRLGTKNTNLCYAMGHGMDITFM